MKGTTRRPTASRQWHMRETGISHELTATSVYFNHVEKDPRDHCTMICLRVRLGALLPPTTPSSRAPFDTMLGWQQDWRRAVKVPTRREGRAGCFVCNGETGSVIGGNRSVSGGSSARSLQAHDPQFASHLPLSLEGGLVGIQRHGEAPADLWGRFG